MGIFAAQYVAELSEKLEVKFTALILCFIFYHF